MNSTTVIRNIMFVHAQISGSHCAVTVNNSLLLQRLKMNGRLVFFCIGLWINYLGFEVVTLMWCAEESRGYLEVRVGRWRFGKVEQRGWISQLPCPAASGLQTDRQTDRRSFLLAGETSFRWKCCRLFVAPVFVHPLSLLPLTVSVFLPSVLISVILRLSRDSDIIYCYLGVFVLFFFLKPGAKLTTPPIEKKKRMQN